MKRIPSFRFLPLLFASACFFSCEHKSGMDKKNTTDTAATYISPGKTENTAIVSWVIDAQASQVKFVIKNMGLNVDGTFGGLKGTIYFDEQNLKNSNVDVSVDVNTISTGIKKRDKDLMDEKFFNEEKYKHIIFRSDSITKNGNGYMAYGNLTIKGKSERRNIPFTFSQKETTGIFRSDFTVNRLDFNVGGDGPVMGSEAKVSIEIVTKKQ